MSEIGNIFYEEEKHLSNVISIVKRKINLLREKMPYPNVSRYAVGYDRDEISDLQYAKRRNEKTLNKINELSEFTYSPYFARMDFTIFDSPSTLESVYIGKDSIYIDNKQYVYDWRSPVGQRYYLKNELEFTYNRYIYILQLRRALDVKNGQLIAYNDEYSGENRGSDRLVSDPFLVRLLKEKRVEYALTDIIRTIQGNQNDIIRQEPSTSFIVQGCAGSGKTMILLHRLSYLMFNYPSLSLSKIKIITPNNNFNLHINDLSKSLKLDLIEKYTVEDYYCFLLKKYKDKNLGAMNTLETDSDLDGNFIESVYSEEFQYNCIKFFNLYSNNMITNLEIDKINAICKSHSIDIFSNQSINLSKKLERYSEFLNRIISYNKLSVEKNEKARLDLIKMEEGLNQLKKHSELKSENEVGISELKNNYEGLYQQISNVLNSGVCQVSCRI